MANFFMSLNTSTYNQTKETKSPQVANHSLYFGDLFLCLSIKSKSNNKDKDAKIAARILKIIAGHDIPQIKTLIPKKLKIHEII